MTHINAIGSRRLITMISFTSLSALPEDAVTLISLFFRLVAGRVVLSLPSSAVTFSDFLDKDLLSGLLLVSVKLETSPIPTVNAYCLKQLGSEFFCKI